MVEKLYNFLLVTVAMSVLLMPTSSIGEENPPPSSSLRNLEHSDINILNKVFGIPAYGIQNTNKETLHNTLDTLSLLLDRNHNGKPDNPNLVRFMRENGYKLVVSDLNNDLDNLDESEFPEEKTALVSPRGIRADSYLTEPLRLVAQARIDQLRTSAEKGDEQSKIELQDLHKAIIALNKNGFHSGADDDDDIDLSDYIVLSGMVLAGQFQAYFDRVLGVLKVLLKKVAESEGKDFDNSELDKEFKSFKSWYETSPDSFRRLAPDICEWLKRNNLTSTTQVISSDPVDIDDETVSDLLKDPFDEDE